MTNERADILKNLQRNDWYKNTNQSIKDNLQDLPEDFNPFLEDLAKRPEEIGELDILKMIKLGRGHFMIMPVFEVRSTITNQVFTYEYVSWKTGSNPGNRGVIFLETDGRISHFLTLKSHKFSTATETYDSIGGLYLRFYNNKPENLPKKIETEIKFHLGLKEIEFKKIINLGQCHPDYGMTNNKSDLYAATIDVSHIPNLTTKDDFRLTHKPVGFELQIVPVSELPDYILNKIDDNYFLSTIARCLATPSLEITL